MTSSIGHASGATPFYVHALTLSPLQAFDRQSITSTTMWRNLRRQSLPRSHPAKRQIQKSWFWPSRVIKLLVFGTETDSKSRAWSQSNMQLFEQFFKNWEVMRQNLGPSQIAIRKGLSCILRYVFCYLLLHKKVPYSCKGIFLLPLQFTASCSKLQRRLTWSSISYSLNFEERWKYALKFS